MTEIVALWLYLWGALLVAAVTYEWHGGTRPAVHTSFALAWPLIIPIVFVVQVYLALRGDER